MRLASFNVAELGFMVNGLIHLAERNDRSTRRKKSSLDGIYAEWAKDARDLAKKLYPILKDAERAPVTGLAVRGHEPAPEIARSVPEEGPPRLVLLSVHELKTLGTAVAHEVGNIEARLKPEKHPTAEDRKYTKFVRAEVVACRRLAARIDRLHLQAQRSKKISVAMP